MKRTILACWLGILTLTLPTPPGLAQDVTEEPSDWRGIWFLEGSAPAINGYSPPAENRKPWDPYVLLDWESPPYNEAGRAAVGRMLGSQGAGKLQSWGFPMMMSSSAPIQFLLTPAETIILSADRDVRHVYTDGRALPAEEDRWLTVWGESVGRWEGATLVVETVSVSEPLGYVFFGPAFSSSARYTERIRMTGPDRIENEMTIVDPERLTAPWTATMVYVRAEGLDRLIHDASTNDRNAAQGDLLTILPPKEGER